jgi:hypothetical protein
MAFDSTLPQANSEIDSAELRGQFNGLKELIDQRPTTADMTAASAANINGTIANLPLTFSNPPTYNDLLAIWGED